MLKHFFLSMALATICSCAATSANTDQSVRLDAASDSTAQQSFDKMLSQSSTKRQQELAIAVLKLNMSGVKSAHDVVRRPELQHPSILRIKDRVAGMTADEIIDLADRTSNVKIEVQSK
jgi:membrane-bound lytic murein transglycosylase B